MQLTRAADYAVRVMIHLASQPEGSVVSKTVLAKAAEAPESFLSKILQTLARAGLIQARRGVVGGFLLLPRGAQASLLDVVESIDGPIALNVCLTSGNLPPSCRLRRAPGLAAGAVGNGVGSARGEDCGDGSRNGNSCRPCWNIAAITGSGKEESSQLSSPGGSADKNQMKAQPHTAPTGAGAHQTQEKNIKN